MVNELENEFRIGLNENLFDLVGGGGYSPKGKSENSVSFDDRVPGFSKRNLEIQPGRSAGSAWPFRLPGEDG